MDFGENIWDVDWDEPGEYEREAETAGYGGVRGKRLRRQLGAALSSAVWELDPGATQSPYHFHHGGEEFLIVLRGSPTLRSPEGDRELKEGEVVHFPRGQEGAHQVSNRSSEVARYVIAASQGTPEIVEYPDSGKIAAMARTETSAGARSSRSTASLTPSTTTTASPPESDHSRPECRTQRAAELRSWSGRATSGVGEPSRDARGKAS